MLWKVCVFPGLQCIEKIEFITLIGATFKWNIHKLLLEILVHYSQDVESWVTWQKRNVHLYDVYVLFRVSCYVILLLEFYLQWNSNEFLTLRCIQRTNRKTQSTPCLTPDQVLALVKVKLRPFPALYNNILNLDMSTKQILTSYNFFCKFFASIICKY